MSVSDGSPIFWFQMGLRWGMSILDGSPMKHVEVRWVFDQTCQSPTEHVEVSDGSPIRQVGLR